MNCSGALIPSIIFF